MSLYASFNGTLTTTIDEIESILTHTSWRYRGPHEIKAVGKSGLLRGVQAQQQKTVSSIRAIAKAAQDLAQAANQSTQLINDAIGGHVLIRREPGGTNEILIMDHEDPAQAVKIWRWNLGGLGYSDNCTGADNPQRQYEVAMTMDGAINANFIKTGKIAAQYITVGPETVFADGYDPTAIQIGGRNLIIRHNEVPDTMIGENGVSAPLAGSSMVNDFIPVQPGDTLTFSQIIQSGTGDDYFRCAFYTDPLDNASYVIRRISNDSTEFQETVPEGAYWARVSYATKNKVQLERGNKATDWAPAPEEAEAVARAEAKLAEIQAKAYADGKITEEEQARIDQAEANLAAAKAYAEEKAGEAEQAAQAYADEQIDTHDANPSPHNLPSYARMESTGFKVYDDQGNLRTHMGQYAPGEFGNWVDAGHYLLRDKNMDMSLMQLPNLIADHSFECLEQAGHVTGYHDFEVVGGLNFFEWMKVGAPKVNSARGTGGEFIDALHGLQCAVVNSTNYLETHVKRTRSLQYFVSGFACRGHRNPDAGTAKIRIEAYDVNYNKLATTEQTFTLDPTIFEYRRVGFKFTVPLYTDTIKISVLSADSDWVYWDGMQLVEGDKPVRYEPEENLWRHMFGVSGLPSLGHVVDSGSNSNGSWIRFSHLTPSSGVQICWSTVTLTYEHSGLLNTVWYYPYGFPFSPAPAFAGFVAPAKYAPIVGARGKTDHIIKCDPSFAEIGASGQAGIFSTGDKWDHHVVIIGWWWK